MGSALSADISSHYIALKSNHDLNLLTTVELRLSHWGQRNIHR